MLHRIPNTLTPELIYILSKMGHGDEIVIADANFPAASTSSFCKIKDPIYIPNVNAPKIISDICKLLPIDHFSEYGAARMEIDGMPDEEGDVHIRYQPSRPHCPCCLIDARTLRRHLAGIKGVNSLQFEIVDVPASERWSRLVND